MVLWESWMEAPLAIESWWSGNQSLRQQHKNWGTDVGTSSSGRDDNMDSLQGDGVGSVSWFHCSPGRTAASNLGNFGCSLCSLGLQGVESYNKSSCEQLSTPPLFPIILQVSWTQALLVFTARCFRGPFLGCKSKIQVWSPNPSLLGEKLELEFSLNCMMLCWGWVHGENVSAFPTHFNVNIFLFTWCVSQFLYFFQR